VQDVADVSCLIWNKPRPGQQKKRRGVQRVLLLAMGGKICGGTEKRLVEKGEKRKSKARRKGGVKGKTGLIRTIEKFASGSDNNKEIKTGAF